MIVVKKGSPIADSTSELITIDIDSSLSVTSFRCSQFIDNKRMKLMRTIDLAKKTSNCDVGDVFIEKIHRSSVVTERYFALFISSDDSYSLFSEEMLKIAYTNLLNKAVEMGIKSICLTNLINTYIGVTPVIYCPTIAKVLNNFSHKINIEIITQDNVFYREMKILCR